MHRVVNEGLALRLAPHNHAALFKERSIVLSYRALDSILLRTITARNLIIGCFVDLNWSLSGSILALQQDIQIPFNIRVFTGRSD